MTGYKSKKAAALDEEGMYLVHHTNIKDQALKLALEAFETAKFADEEKAIAAIKEALAQPPQEQDG